MNKMIAQSHSKDLLRSAKRFKTNNAERPEYIHELLPALLIVNIYKFLGTEDSKNLMLEALKYFDDKSKHDPGNVETDLFDQFLLFLNTTTEITKKERIIVIRRLIQKKVGYSVLSARTRIIWGKFINGFSINRRCYKKEIN